MTTYVHGVSAAVAAPAVAAAADAVKGCRFRKLPHAESTPQGAEMFAAAVVMEAETPFFRLESQGRLAMKLSKM